MFGYRIREAKTGRGKYGHGIRKITVVLGEKKDGSFGKPAQFVEKTGVRIRIGCQGKSYYKKKKNQQPDSRPVG